MEGVNGRDEWKRGSRGGSEEKRRRHVDAQGAGRRAGHLLLPL